MRQRKRNKIALGAALCLVSACGGKEKLAPSGAAGAGSLTPLQAAAGATQSASVGAAGSNEFESAGAAGEAASPPNYVPTQDVPFDQTYLADGSFESNQGVGYDTCATRTPASLRNTTDGASEGSRAFQFSSGPCAGLCSPSNPSDAQLYVWFTQPPTSAMALYFDVKSLSQAAPAGELRLAAVDLACVSLRDLARAALSDLAIEATWQTRCVDLPALTAEERLGIAVTGTSFQIALDALRIGPPCH